jgi:hypothetical protein
MSDRKNWFWAGVLLYAMACKLLPWGLSHFGMPLDPATTWYPWNFAPLMAVSLFCGAGIKSPRWAFLWPVVVVAVSDFGIGLLTQNWQWAFPPSEALTLGSFALAVGMGRFLQTRPEWQLALPLGWLAETVFFLVTNFGVWWMGEGLTPYPFTLSGLAFCYWMGLPFFGRSLLSTSIYVGVLFSPVSLRLAGMEPAEQGRMQPAVVS